MRRLIVVLIVLAVASVAEGWGKKDDVDVAKGFIFNGTSKSIEKLIASHPGIKQNTVVWADRETINGTHLITCSFTAKGKEGTVPFILDIWVNSDGSGELNLVQMGNPYNPDVMNHANVNAFLYDLEHKEDLSYTECDWFQPTGLF